MRKHPLLLKIAIFLLILAAVPLLQSAARGGRLRVLPGFRTQEPSADAVQDGIVAEYGYAPDDGWVERHCAFTVRTGSEGRIVLELYYPFALTGGETGRITVDGDDSVPFALAGENTAVTLAAAPNATHRVVIDCDFAAPNDGSDQRDLAFVLAACAGE